MNDDDKEYIKIFSLNLMAFIVANTGEKYKLHYEYDSHKGQKYYAVFTDTDEVRKAMEDYKNDEWLKKYLSSLKEIIDRKNGIKESINLWNK